MQNHCEMRPVRFAGLETMIKVLCRKRRKICRFLVFGGDVSILYSNRDDDDEQLNPNVDEWFYIHYKDEHFQPIIPDKVHQLFTGNCRAFCNHCRKPYQKDHVCPKVCAMCGDSTDHHKLFKTTENWRCWRKCGSCHRKFYTVECFNKHLENKTC